MKDNYQKDLQVAGKKPSKHKELRAKSKNKEKDLSVPSDSSETKKIHIDKLDFTDKMKVYAGKRGINGHAIDVFGKMVQNVHKKGERLTRTIRQWEAQYQTFVDNTPKYNPEFIDQSDPTCSVCGVNPITKNGKCHLCIRKEAH